jgi:hypothetical protein
VGRRVTPYSVRFASAYVAAILIVAGVLVALITWRSAEYVEYVPLVLIAFGFPWSLSLWLGLPETGVAIALTAGLPLNTLLLFWLGRSVDRRRGRTRAPAAQAT